MAVFLRLLRRRGRLLLLFFELLALVHPALHADRPLAEDRRRGTVVDVRPQRVERDPAEHQALLPRDFRAAQAALGQQLDPLRPEVHHHLGVAAHRTAVGRAALQLLRDRLRDDHRVQLRRLELLDVDLDRPSHQAAHVLAHLVDLRAALADDQARARGPEPDPDLLADPLDVDAGDAGERVLLADELADLEILHQPVPVIFLAGVPTRAPRFGDAHAERDRIDLLAHLLLLLLGLRVRSRRRGLVLLRRGLLGRRRALAILLLALRTLAARLLEVALLQGEDHVAQPLLDHCRPAL